MPPGDCPFPAFPPTFSELFASVTFALFCVRLLFTDCIHFEISLNFFSILTYFLGRIFPSVYSFISDISRAFGKKSIYYIWRLGIYNIFLFFCGCLCKKHGLLSFFMRWICYAIFRLLYLHAVLSFLFRGPASNLQWNRLVSSEKSLQIWGSRA